MLLWGCVLPVHLAADGKTPSCGATSSAGPHAMREPSPLLANGVARLTYPGKSHAHASVLLVRLHGTLQYRVFVTAGTAMPHQR